MSNLLKATLWVSKWEASSVRASGCGAKRERAREINKKEKKQAFNEMLALYRFESNRINESVDIFNLKLNANAVTHNNRKTIERPALHTQYTYREAKRIKGKPSQWRTAYAAYDTHIRQTAISSKSTFSICFLFIRVFWGEHNCFCNPCETLLRRGNHTTNCTFSVCRTRSKQGKSLAHISHIWITLSREYRVPFVVIAGPYRVCIRRHWARTLLCVCFVYVRCYLLLFVTSAHFVSVLHMYVHTLPASLYALWERVYVCVCVCAPAIIVNKTLNVKLMVIR